MDITTLSIARKYGNISTGNANKKYKVVACVLRNTGSVWTIINDTDHAPIGVQSVDIFGSDIKLTYDFTAKTVGTLVVVPDETYVRNGINFGASVGFSTADIWGYINKTLGGYIFYNGTSWDFSNARGVSGVSFSGGNLTITHDTTDLTIDGDDAFDAYVSCRDGIYVVSIGAMGYTTTVVTFRDYAGLLVATPTTDMKIYFNHPISGTVSPSKIAIPNSNIWCYGIFEI